MLPITVAIADFDPIGYKVCERLLRSEGDIWVVAQAVTREEAMATAKAFQPRILLCNFGLAASAGFDLLQAIHCQCRTTRVVLLTHGGEEEGRVMQALDRGAWGYLGRDDLRWQLCEALHRVDEGEIWVPRQMLGQLLERAAAGGQG